MNAINNTQGNHPAFPCALPITTEHDVMISDPNATGFGALVKQKKTVQTQFPGMSLRAWLAGKALQGLLAAEDEGEGFCFRDTATATRHQNAAQEAVRMADAVLAELSK
jgi:hypothetical protein